MVIDALIAIETGIPTAMEVLLFLTPPLSGEDGVVCMGDDDGGEGEGTMRGLM